MTWHVRVSEEFTLAAPFKYIQFDFTIFSNFEQFAATVIVFTYAHDDCLSRCHYKIRDVATALAFFNFEVKLYTWILACRCCRKWKVDAVVLEMMIRTRNDAANAVILEMMIRTRNDADNESKEEQNVLLR